MNRTSVFKSILACVLLFAIPSIAKANAGPQCLNLFAFTVNPQLEKAILAGIKIFDQQQFYADKVEFAFSYFHGTSVESIARSVRSSSFFGSPVRDFEQLGERFYFYKNKMVVHALQNKAGKFDERDRHSIASYSQLSAKRFYLLRFLGDPALYNSFFLFDLITFVENGSPLGPFITSYKEEGFFDTRPELLSRLENADLTFLGKKIPQRKGVVVVIDAKVQADEDMIIEHDVEHGGAMALISDQGVAFDRIRAIVPQSRVERDELVKLLRQAL